MRVVIMQKLTVPSSALNGFQRGVDTVETTNTALVLILHDRLIEGICISRGDMFQIVSVACGHRIDNGLIDVEGIPETPPNMRQVGPSDYTDRFRRRRNDRLAGGHKC